MTTNHTVINVNNSRNVQVATGEANTQTIADTSNEDRIKLVVEGLAQLLIANDVADRDQVQDRRDEVLYDLDSAKPSGEPARRFLSWVVKTVQAGTASAINAVMVAAALQALQELPGVFHELEQHI